MAENFKFDINVRDIKTKETIRGFVAKEDLRNDLADRFGLNELSSFEASFMIIQLEEGTLFQVQVSIKAKAVIETPAGDMVNVTVDDHEEDIYTTRKDLAFASEGEDDEFDPYAPDYIEDGIIDLADMAFDYLALMLDEVFSDEVGEFAEDMDFLEDEEEMTETRKPFANLKELIDKKDDDE